MIQPTPGADPFHASEAIPVRFAARSPRMSIAARVQLEPSRRPHHQAAPRRLPAWRRNPSDYRPIRCGRLNARRADAHSAGLSSRLNRFPWPALRHPESNHRRVAVVIALFPHRWPPLPFSTPGVRFARVRRFTSGSNNRPLLPIRLGPPSPAGFIHERGGRPEGWARAYLYK